MQTPATFKPPPSPRSMCKTVIQEGVSLRWPPSVCVSHGNWAAPSRHAPLQDAVTAPGDISLSRLRHSRIPPEGAAGCIITSSLSLPHGIISADISESTKSRDSPNSPTSSCVDTICRKCVKGVLRQHIMAAECLRVALFCPVDPAVGPCVLG